MRERIHPNRWINSERGDESAGGGLRDTICLPLLLAQASTLQGTCKRLARRVLWASWGGLVRLSELREQYGFSSFAHIGFLRLGPGMGGWHRTTLLWVPLSICELWKHPSTFPFPFSSTLVITSTDTTQFSSSLRELISLLYCYY